MKIECLSPFVFSTAARGSEWLYVLNPPVSFRIRGLRKRNVDFYHGNTRIGDQRGDVITIAAHYAWNGMSGWEDHPRNILGSLWHDFCYQLGDRFLPRAAADKIFYQLLQQKNYSYALPCYLAVRTIGWMFFFSDPKSIHVKPIQKENQK